MSENTTPTYDIDILKNALIEDHLELQVETIQKIQLLANALGPEATRDQLLPFIQERFVELHDEVLLHLARQLKHFIPLVGGLEHSKIVFDILAKLCITDETIVRDAAVNALIHIQEQLSTEETEQFLLPVIDQLTSEDWFTGKCSAVMLFSPFYGKLSEKGKTDLRNSLKTLIQDDSPMVRKAAAVACIGFVAVVEHEYLTNEFVPIFNDIALDPMDSVRSMTIDIALALVKRLQHDDLDTIFKTIENASDDASWRIRQRLANHIAALQREIPHGKYRGKLIVLVQKLAQDIEQEVRVLVASHLFDYCKYLRDSYLSHPQNQNNFEPVFEESILKVIQRLALDDVEDVRLALSSNMLPLGSLLSEEFFKKHIVSFLWKVMDNEPSITIQTEFLLGLGTLSSNLDLGQSLDAIKNAVRAVIVRSQANWRTRRSVLKTFLNIAKFCDKAYFSDNFKIYYAALLGDSIYAVRRSAVLVLPILSKHYGIKWSAEHLVPYFTIFTKDTRYLYRFISLYGIQEMVNPYLCSPAKSYLKDFQSFVNSSDAVISKKAVTSLAKIRRVSHLIQKTLKDPPYSEMLKLIKELDYTTDSDINVYLEMDFDDLKARYQNFELYSVESRDFEEDQQPYLQGILSLIYEKFLPILETLNKDSTENIQIRSIYTLTKVAAFGEALEVELSAKWVQNSIESLRPEEVTAVHDEIHQEFKTANLEDEENIDTNLMDTTSRQTDVVLNETICIENSNAKLTEDTSESLAEEMMKVLDEKMMENKPEKDDEEIKN